MNDVVQKPNWFKRNWKWLVPLFILLILFVLSLPKGTGNIMLHYAKGYSDAEVTENALEIVKKNKRVLQMLGELEPIGQLTILEGYVKYSKNADSVFMALTIKGKRGEIWLCRMRSSTRKRARILLGQTVYKLISCEQVRPSPPKAEHRCDSFGRASLFGCKVGRDESLKFSPTVIMAETIFNILTL